MPFNPMSFLQDSLMTKYFCSTFLRNVFQDKPFGHLKQRNIYDFDIFFSAMADIYLCQLCEVFTNVCSIYQ